MLFCCLFLLYCLLCLFGWSLVRVSSDAYKQTQNSKPLYAEATSEQNAETTLALTSQPLP